MGNAFVFGVAVGLTALAWSIARFQPSATPNWKAIGRNILFSILFATSLGTAGGIFWQIGQQGILDAIKSPLRQTGQTTTAIASASKPTASTPVIPAIPSSAPSAPASESASVTPNHTKSADTAPPGNGEKSDYKLPQEVWLAIASLVMAIVTGVYLVAIQNTLQAGRELVKEMGEQRKQLEKELIEINNLKKSRSELAGGLAESLERTISLLTMVTDQLSASAMPNSQQQTDFENFKRQLDDISKELHWVTRVNGFIVQLRAENLGMADTEAAQIKLFLTTNGANSELTKVIVRLLRETMSQLKKEKNDEFNSLSRHQNLPELLDKLMEFDA